MKKVILLLAVLFSLGGLKSQQWTTGEVTLASNFKVTFVSNTSTNQVTMTVVGPSSVWFAVAPGSSTMANAGGDVIAYHSSNLSDMNFTGSFSAPNTDANQNWTVQSNTSSGTQRTIVATRAINTGDSVDYTFPTSATTFPLVWAIGSGPSLAYHASRGSSSASTSLLGTAEVEMKEMEVSYFPNPVVDFINISSKKSTAKLLIDIYSIAGEKIIENASLIDGRLDVSNLKTGVYIVSVTDGGDLNESFKFIKK